MDQATLISLQLYSGGGYGIIHTNNGNFHAIIWTVDTENETVSVSRVDLRIGERVIASAGKIEASADESRIPLTLSFDEITRFQGLRTAENNR